MSNSIQAGLIFLINTVFEIFLFILTIRIILVWVGANYFNPATRFITKCTDFIIKPLRRLIPNYRRIEFSSIVLLLLLQFIKFFLICLLGLGTPVIIGLIILAIAASLKVVIQVFIYAIIFQAILSWVQPNSLVNQELYQFTSPIMRPIQRVVPPIGGIDISPIPALIILQLLSIVLVNPFMTFGIQALG